MVYGYQFLYNRGSDKEYLPLAKKGVKAWRKGQPSSRRLPVPVPEEAFWALGHVLLELIFYYHGNSCFDLAANDLHATCRDDHPFPPSNLSPGRRKP